MRFGPVRSLFACAALLLASHAPAQETPTLDGVVARNGSRMDAGGIIAAEAHGNEVHYAVGGKPVPRAEIPPEKVIFEIGSISKVFTCLILGQAVADHRVALDDPISKYLPKELKLDPWVAQVSLLQLATHSSGLPRMPNNFHPVDPGDPYADYSVQDLYEFLGKFHPKAAPPQPPVYSNLGVGLLGQILSRVYGKPYPVLLKEMVTDPMGLEDTTIALTDEQKTRVAVPNSGSQEVEPWHLNALQGAGAIRSTAADLVHFAQELMSEGNPLAQAWAIVKEPRGNYPGGGGPKIGLAVRMVTGPVGPVYSHNGGTGGYRTLLQWTPQTKHVLVVLIDNDTPDPSVIAAQLRPRAAAPALERLNRPESPLPAEQTKDYVGVYVLNEQAKFTALVGPDGRLQVKLTGQRFIPMFYAGKDRFFYRLVDAEIQFHRDADGSVDSLTLFQNDQEQTAKRTDEAVPTVIFPTADDLRPLVGSYRLGAERSFDVALRGGQLFVKLTGQPSFPVFEDKPNHFFYDVVDASLTFERPPDGPAKVLILHQNGLNLRAVRSDGKTPASAPKEIAVTAAEIAPFDGTYTYQSHTFLITHDDGQLFVQYDDGPKNPAFADAKDHFFLKIVDAKFSFTRAPDGSIAGMEIDQNGAHISAARSQGDSSQKSP